MIDVLLFLQRSLDTRQPVGKSDVHDKLTALTARLNVLEEAITADQEQSLSTLEAIMRITKRNGVSASQDIDDASPSSGVRAVSPHLLYASGRLPGAPLRPAASTGILSVKVTPQ